MIATLFQIVPERHEPYDAFQQRRHQQAAALSRQMGLWSNAWAQSVVNRAAHVDRKLRPAHLVEAFAWLAWTCMAGLAEVALVETWLFAHKFEMRQGCARKALA